MSTDLNLNSGDPDAEMAGSRTPTMFHMEDDPEHDASSTRYTSFPSSKDTVLPGYESMDIDNQNHGISNRQISDQDDADAVNGSVEAQLKSCPPPPYTEPSYRKPYLLSGDVLEDLRLFDDKQSHARQRSADSSANTFGGITPRQDNRPLRDRYLYESGLVPYAVEVEAEPQASLYVLSVDKDRIAFHTAMGLPDFVPKSEKATGDTSLVVVIPSEPKFTIEGLSFAKIEAKCPLLAYSFDEPNGAGQMKATFEAQSRQLAVGFLRHLYQGSYIIRDQDGILMLDDSLLFHAKLYHMAVNYDVPSLKKEAALNMLRVTEFSCSFPHEPLDLCSTIRLVYTSLGKEELVRGILKNYSVTCFKYHELNESSEFRELVSEFPQFGVDLCLLNFERNFVDDGAAEIIDLTFAHTLPPTHIKHSDITDLRDFVYHLWGPDTFKDRCGYDSVSSISSAGSFTVVHRPKLHTESDDSALETPHSVSETDGEDDFTVVKRHASLPYRPMQLMDLSTTIGKQISPDKDYHQEAISDEGILRHDKGPKSAVKSSSNTSQVEATQSVLARRLESGILTTEHSMSAIRHGKKLAREDGDSGAFDNRPNAFAFAELLTNRLEAEKSTTNSFESAYEASDTAKALKEVEDMELREALHAISLMEAQEALDRLKAKEKAKEKLKIIDKAVGVPDPPPANKNREPLDQSPADQNSSQVKAIPSTNDNEIASTTTCVDASSAEDDCEDDFILL